MKRLLLFIISVVLILFVIVYLARSLTHQAVYHVMGTEVKITVYDPNASSHIKAAIDRIRQIEKLLSRYDRNSEVSRLNCGENFSPSPDTAKCLALAEKAKQLTGGAFDAYYSGKLDLDGIGKGFAVEEARGLLFKRGVKSGIIDMRSSIAVLGGPFKIGIVHPRKKGEILGVIAVGGGDAASTSGDYEQGQHIIDPMKKHPAALCESVTLVAGDAGLADALSTGIFVLGPEKGIALAKKLNIKALIVGADGKVYKNNI